MIPPTNSLGRLALILFIYPILAVHAFASPPSAASNLARSQFHRPGLNGRWHHNKKHRNQHRHGRGRGSMHTRSALQLHTLIPRGGAAASAVAAAAGEGFISKMSLWTSSPNSAFNLALGILAASTAGLKLFGMAGRRDNSGDGVNGSTKDPKVKSLQIRFLAVFWLLRMADWLQGPYFYQVYASKSFGGATGAMTWVSRLFLTGFASTALFGPIVGRLCDSYGRKAGTLAFSLLYSLGAYSTKSTLLSVLLMGRVMGGIGTSLLFSAPEAWLVGEAGREGVESSLGDTFGLAYAGDSIVAILAGQIAGFAASQRGPTGPFEVSVGFLIMGGLLASMLWKENVASNNSSTESIDSQSESTKPTIRDAVKVVKSDPKIMLVGAMQSLFESAMYIFVLNWPPAVSKAVSTYFAKFAKDASSIGTPYGTVFSCFMACCLLGSTLFGQLTSSSRVDKDGKSKSVSTENFAVGMLTLATLAMGCATMAISSGTLGVLSRIPILSNILSFASPAFSSPGSVLGVLILSLFFFEACVGMYFPAIGTLRSKYFPDSHRSVVMNLFGIPLNAMVVSVFLSIERLGVQGALGVSTAALATALGCSLKLKGIVNKSAAKL
ncbi:hypothetical protein HJC23_009596 [Cyclotella cryptica]|uniref:Molybdate-anion transporter n=1 Tax=Cyclotella cryptica TaxID=29204 RepID=A0ABD3PR27_9STRA|eukprot:CCRYP_012574-RA/>CCRYP_012574-RA protein AED:0.05 eAED:0.05 QI:554/0.66/0.5/1/1/1/4/0/608